ncbi:hypothetical protein I8D64_11695 [Brachybacterium sp. MASK1Z-5]|uniref:Uncharacterized protein n=1 Tax=Brachybacterium halotolerans TaxID=2795215 RepID=A0ABS1BC27_9MICO|nr:hypothetical protein [Brachybacterium halotolerans]MBK0332062.1 hypothetical protein [Brachybacterium halotolerans]
MSPLEIPTVLTSRLREDPPVQRAFSWRRETWEPVVHDVPDAAAALHDLPDQIDRQIVRDVVQANLSREHVLGALVPMLIWGGTGPRRAFFARAILTGLGRRGNFEVPVDDSIRDRLLAGARVVQQDGAAAGFFFMNNEGRVKHLGGAFFTKWLAFTSMTGDIDGPEVAPILDKRVITWIRKNTTPAVELTTTRTASYQRYLELLDAWGSPHGRTRTQVELAIFEITRGR